mgnify:CR=1 FL=1
MKEIAFRKILGYDPTLGGKFSRYGGYCLITEQKQDPSIIKPENEIFDFPKDIYGPIFCSSLKRGIDSASYVCMKTGLTKVVLPELNEINFSLEDLLSEEEYLEQGSDLVRKRFVEYFVEDKFKEKRGSIQDRTHNLLARFNVLPEGRHLAISHSFFMKIFEAYSKEPTLFEEPELLANYLDPFKKIYMFGQGFELKL